MYKGMTNSHDARLFFTRQPIFGKNDLVWGHQLLSRDAPWLNEGNGTDHRSAIDGASPRLTKDPNLLARTYACLPGQVGSRKILVGFSERSVLADEPRALSPLHTVIAVRETASIRPDYLAALDSLKKDRYAIAIDDFEGLVGAEALLRRADIVKINVIGKTQTQILQLMKAASGNGEVLIAKGIENRKHLQLAQALGFTHFQGTFFRKPDIVPGRALTSNQIARLRLFKIIETGTPDFNRLAEAISMDASISYRLLVFLNSAAFSFPVEVTSISHAVVMLGWEQVKTWLRMAILNDLAPSEKSAELVKLAAQRSNFFRLAAQRSQYTALPADELFLLGLFSLLEPLLDMPVAEIVENLPISPELKAGLRQETKIYRVWVELAQRIEAADWSNVDRIIAFLGLDPACVTNSYYDANVLITAFFGAGD